MMTFSITGSQIFFAKLLFLPETNEKPHTGLSFTTLQESILINAFSHFVPNFSDIWLLMWCDIFGCRYCDIIFTVFLLF